MLKLLYVSGVRVLREIRAEVAASHNRGLDGAAG
jgi:hypothetical protein